MTEPRSNRKVCLVTGVGPGTGKAIVERFSEGGYDVAMLARNEERLTSIQEQVARTHSFPCDVAAPDALARSVANIKTEFGAPTVVIHNAVGEQTPGRCPLGRGLINGPGTIAAPSGFWCALAERRPGIHFWMRLTIL
jgi:NAD(P)-dependent dehydrogenase (short-subunit alcohol dehydrogenase family)